VSVLVSVFVAVLVTGFVTVLVTLPAEFRRRPDDT
jgi:hypothetical protein